MRSPSWCAHSRLKPKRSRDTAVAAARTFRLGMCRSMKAARRLSGTSRRANTRRRRTRLFHRRSSSTQKQSQCQTLKKTRSGCQYRCHGPEEKSGARSIRNDEQSSAQHWTDAFQPTLWGQNPLGVNRANLRRCAVNVVRMHGGAPGPALRAATKTPLSMDGIREKPSKKAACCSRCCGNCGCSFKSFDGRRATRRLRSARMVLLPISSALRLWRFCRVPPRDR